MNHYEFEVFAKGTLHYLSTWECDAETEQIAVMQYIHQLSDLSICEDEYEIARSRAIIEKLAGKEYEVEPCDGYITITAVLTIDEVDRFI